MRDVLTFGETMGAVRCAGALALGGPAAITVAGAEATVAIGLARLGHDVTWAGLVGDDELGRLVLRTLRAEGVDVGHTGVVAHGPTGLALFEPRVADLIRVAYYRSGSAGSRLHPRDLDTALAQGCRVLHVTGITSALGPGPAAAVAHAVRAAAEAGATVCLDVNFRSRLWSRTAAAAALQPLLPHVDVLVASDDELGVVTDAPPAALLDHGIVEVVVKRGAGGARAITASGVMEHVAVSVPVRDTVGAGDAFVAGYLSALLDGQPVAERLHRAVTCGAFAVATAGDWEGLPRRDELDLLAAPSGSTVR